MTEEGGPAVERSGPDAHEATGDRSDTSRVDGSDEDPGDVAMISKAAPHPAHAGFAEAIGATRIELEPVRLSGTVLEDVFTGFGTRGIGEYDVYLLEDVGELFGVPFLGRGSDATVVLLAASHQTTLDGYDLRPTGGLKRAARWFERRVDFALVRRLVRRYVDGVVANSELSAGYVRQFAPEVPIRVAEPYVQPSVYDRLQSVEPSLDTRTAVFVGQAREHKGVDLLVEAWPEVRRRVPGARLELVGREHDERHDRVEGVTVRGYVERLDEVFEAASLYVHPARYEPWGVAPVEAMLAGVPAAVTDRTGVAPHAAAVDERLVVPPTPSELADVVAWYFRRGTGTKRRLSSAARERARPFDERTRTDAFERTFRELVSEIG